MPSEYIAWLIEPEEGFASQKIEDLDDVSKVLKVMSDAVRADTVLDHTYSEYIESIRMALGLESRAPKKIAVIMKEHLGLDAISPEEITAIAKAVNSRFGRVVAHFGLSMNHLLQIASMYDIESDAGIILLALNLGVELPISVKGRMGRPVANTQLKAQFRSARQLYNTTAELDTILDTKIAQRVGLTDLMNLARTDNKAFAGFIVNLIKNQPWIDTINEALVFSGDESRLIEFVMKRVLGGDINTVPAAELRRAIGEITKILQAIAILSDPLSYQDVSNGLVIRAEHLINERLEKTRNMHALIFDEIREAERMRKELEKQLGNAEKGLTGIEGINMSVVSQARNKLANAKDMNESLMEEDRLNISDTVNGEWIVLDKIIARFAALRKAAPEAERAAPSPLQEKTEVSMPTPEKAETERVRQLRGEFERLTPEEVQQRLWNIAEHIQSESELIRNEILEAAGSASEKRLEKAKGKLDLLRDYAADVIEAAEGFITDEDVILINGTVNNLVMLLRMTRIKMVGGQISETTERPLRERIVEEMYLAHKGFARERAEKAAGAVKPVAIEEQPAPAEKLPPIGGGLNEGQLRTWVERVAADESEGVENLVKYFETTGLYYQIDIVCETLASNPDKLAEFERLLTEHFAKETLKTQGVEDAIIEQVARSIAERVYESHSGILRKDQIITLKFEAKEITLKAEKDGTKLIDLIKQHLTEEAFESLMAEFPDGVIPYEVSYEVRKRSDGTVEPPIFSDKAGIIFNEEGKLIAMTSSETFSREIIASYHSGEVEAVAHGHSEPIISPVNDKDKLAMRVREVIYGKLLPEIIFERGVTKAKVIDTSIPQFTEEIERIVSFVRAMNVERMREGRVERIASPMLSIAFAFRGIKQGIEFTIERSIAQEEAAPTTDQIRRMLEEKGREAELLSMPIPLPIGAIGPRLKTGQDMENLKGIAREIEETGTLSMDSMLSLLENQAGPLQGTRVLVFDASTVDESVMKLAKQLSMSEVNLVCVAIIGREIPGTIFVPREGEGTLSQRVEHAVKQKLGDDIKIANIAIALKGEENKLKETIRNDINARSDNPLRIPSYLVLKENLIDNAKGNMAGALLSVIKEKPCFIGIGYETTAFGSIKTLFERIGGYFRVITKLSEGLSEIFKAIRSTVTAV